MSKKKSVSKPKSRARSRNRTRAGAKKPKQTPQVSVAARLPEVTAEQVKAAQKHYAEAVVARGQAVPQGTPLPPGATHEIVGYDEEGTPLLRRKRFSLRG